MSRSATITYSEGGAAEYRDEMGFPWLPMAGENTRHGGKVRVRQLDQSAKGQDRLLTGTYLNGVITIDPIHLEPGEPIDMARSF